MAMTLDTVIRAEKLRKCYGDLCAVNGIDFEIGRAECFGLLGPNGAGKTTTVKMLTCVLPPTGGDITVAGMSVRNRPRDIKYLLGVCPQEVNLDPDFSVEKNLLVYSRYFDIPKEEALQRARQLIARFHLHDKLERPIEDLSGGLKKRLLIARALINRPEVLVLDEPTTGVDPVSRAGLWRIIATAAARGVHVVVATSYLDEAERAGTVLALGTPDEILANAEVRSVYLGENFRL